MKFSNEVCATVCSLAVYGTGVCNLTVSELNGMEQHTLMAIEVPCNMVMGESFQD